MTNFDIRIPGCTQRPRPRVARLRVALALLPCLAADPALAAQPASSSAGR